MSRKPKRAGLFSGFWQTLEGGRLSKVSRAELAEAYRLRAKHSDLISGYVAFCGCSDTELCAEHSGEMAAAL